MGECGGGTEPSAEVGGPARELLGQAARGVAGAAGEPVATRRFAAAHLAALRGAAAVLAERATAVRAPAGPARSRPSDAWALLAAVAPELGEWARFFARCAPARRGGAVVTGREADDLVRQVGQFLELVGGVVRGHGARPRPARDTRPAPRADSGEQDHRAPDRMSA